MRLFDDVKGYATPDNAIAKLRRALGSSVTLDDVRWMIAVNSAGRFVPVVSIGNDTRLTMLAHFGIAVTS